MSNKISDKNKTVPKKTHVTTSLIAEVTGASQSMVSQVLTGKRNADTDTGQKIQVAEMLLEEKTNLMIQEVKRIVCIK